MSDRLSASPAPIRAISRSTAIALAIVLAGMLMIYLPGLGNGLVFDDTYLTDGLFGDYGSLSTLRARFLSYGSFVWLQGLLGDGWWKQRFLNLGIHVGVVLALWALYREILRCIVPGGGEAEPGSYARSPALPFAIGFFALNPVAVYAVAYLIQRSTLMATFFVVVGLLCLARGLAYRRKWLVAVAVGCYVLAVASKESAILAPLAALPLFVVVARPGAKRLALAAVADLLLVAAMAFVVARRYGQIIGKPFDEYSFVYLAQLGRQAQEHAYGLSIVNEAWLFFRYGLEWMLPWSGWMSINLRPPFPASFASFPQLLGPIGYVAVLGAGCWAVLRHRDWRALAGLSALFAALLYPTEFATVWVQDPFVLYRSYLWAIGIPGIVFLLVHGPSWRVLLATGAIVGGLLVWQAVDRVLSLENAEVAWTDAIAKLSNDPRAVGRWFPYLNRGAIYADSDSFDLALHDFEASAALGDRGMGAFNMGAILSAKGRQAQALAAFDRAEKDGYALYNLPFQRGLALAALNRPEEALRQFERTREMNPPSPAREITLLQLGRVALQLGRRQEGVAALEELVKLQPRNAEASYLLGMGYVMSGEPARAVPVLDASIAAQPSGRAHYARALANYGLKRKADALADIENAIRIGPDNANLQQWRAKILAMP
jgi:tetratricopeptide (TPR) repeat protein